MFFKCYLYHLAPITIDYRLVQHKEAAAKKADNVHEMSKPVARYSDDSDLNSMLKQRARDDDPMSKFTMEKKKKSSELYRTE